MGLSPRRRGWGPIWAGVGYMGFCGTGRGPRVDPGICPSGGPLVGLCRSPPGPVDGVGGSIFSYEGASGVAGL